MMWDDHDPIYTTRECTLLLVLLLVVGVLCEDREHEWDEIKTGWRNGLYTLVVDESTGYTGRCNLILENKKKRNEERKRLETWTLIFIPLLSWSVTALWWWDSLFHELKLYSTRIRTHTRLLTDNHKPVSCQLVKRRARESLNVIYAGPIPSLYTYDVIYDVTRKLQIKITICVAILMKGTKWERKMSARKRTFCFLFGVII